MCFRLNILTRRGALLFFTEKRAVFHNLYKGGHMVIFLKMLAMAFLLLACAIGVFAFYRGQWCARTKGTLIGESTVYAEMLVALHKESVRWFSGCIVAAVVLVEIIVRIGGFEESPRLWRVAHYCFDGLFAVNFAAALITGAWVRDIHKYFVYLLPITACFVFITGFPMFIGWFH